MIQDNALNIYSDGSSYSSPRVGGVGIRFICADRFGNENFIKDLQITGYKGATNNQMELLACIKGLEEAISQDYVQTVDKVVVHTDSLYVKDNYTRALYTWQKSRWCNQHGKPILNADLWKQLLKVVKRLYSVGRRFEIRWVRGHSTDIHNKAVDRLAKQSAKTAINPALTVVQVRRKLSSKRTHIDSVAMKGQRLVIRIVTAEYLRVQRTNKYRYEVMSKHSNYFQCVDTIFGEMDLRGAHYYLVSVHKNQENPTILKVHQEIPRK
ncbi:MAG: ribonuclease HI [Ignavibacteriales bacterium]|nr:ribonuclease HI [Ignavibacteriales bacterium]